MPVLMPVIPTIERPSSAQRLSQAEKSKPPQTLQRLGGPPRKRQIVRVDVCRETDLGIVGLPHHILLRVETVDGGDGAEHLGPAGVHVGAHVA